MNSERHNLGKWMGTLSCTLVQHAELGSVTFHQNILEHQNVPNLLVLQVQVSVKYIWGLKLAIELRSKC